MTIEKLGPYRIEGIVGHGGMGTVYSGVHQETGERAAIKVLSEALSCDPRFRDRFQAEVESLKRLRHPNIVTLLGYGVEDNRLFFTMELVEGASLEAELRQGKRYDWRTTADFGIQICAALKHAHDHGVIHRDLKPGNLLITPDGTVKLTDFGIAKSFGVAGLTLAGSMIGTPEYMAPEQTEGRAATPRSDLYCLGCVMYAMVAGKPPFWNPLITKLIDRVRHESPSPLRLEVTDVPAEFDRLVCQLLAKLPEDRIATPQLLSHLLQAMLHAFSSDTLAGHPTDDQPIPSRKSDLLAETTELVPPDGHTGSAAVEKPDSSEQPTKDVSVTEQLRPEGQDLPIKLTGPETATNRATKPGMHDSGDDDDAAPQTRYTTVSQSEWRQEIAAKPALKTRKRERWILLVMFLTLGTILAAFLYVLSPPSADQLFSRITSTENRLDDSCGELLQEFLKRFPDDRRSDEVEHWFQDYQCDKLRRELKTKLRPLTQPEQAYLLGIEHRNASRHDEAAECFRQIIDSYQPETSGVQGRKLMERARYLLGEEPSAEEASSP